MRGDNLTHNFKSLNLANTNLVDSAYFIQKFTAPHPENKNNTNSN